MTKKREWVEGTALETAIRLGLVSVGDEVKLQYLRPVGDHMQRLVDAVWWVAEVEDPQLDRIPLYIKCGDNTHEIDTDWVSWNDVCAWRPKQNPKKEAEHG